MNFDLLRRWVSWWFPPLTLIEQKKIAWKDESE